MQSLYGLVVAVARDDQPGGDGAALAGVGHHLEGGGADTQAEVGVVEDVTAAGETHSFRVDARGFWQVHPGAAPTFVTHVLAQLAAQPGEHVLDLYCGVGGFALNAAVFDALDACYPAGANARTEAV